MKKIFTAVLVSLLAACTNAGPFVTGISSDGNNGLTIEKCQVHMNAFMGTVSNDNSDQVKINSRRPTPAASTALKLKRPAPKLCNRADVPDVCLLMQTFKA